MSKPVLVIDNFDSFTYNLVDGLAKVLPVSPIVYRNTSLQNLDTKLFSALVISPGPGLPENAGDLLPFLKMWPNHKPVLGICLGMQALISLHGGSLELMPTPKHGIQNQINVNTQSALFVNLSQKQQVGRYHSWVAYDNRIPECYKITATDKVNLVMAIQHKNLPYYGVQFHPESIMTPNGQEMLKNWLNLIN